MFRLPGWIVRLIPRWTISQRQRGGKGSTNVQIGVALVSQRTDLEDLLSGTRPRPSAEGGPPSQTRDALAEASFELFKYPTTVDGLWMHRPELGEVAGRLSSSQKKILVVLGGPGVGKSALLARLAHDARNRGATVFGIKADYLPSSVNSLDDLSRAYSIPRGLVAEISAHGRDGEAMLIVDQLDAVSALTDGEGGRLRAVADLMNRLRLAPGVRICASVRPFEFRHDARFRTALPPDEVYYPDSGTGVHPPWGPATVGGA